MHLKWLPRLKRLDISSNYLSMLPEDLNYLATLEDLNLSSNLFTSLTSIHNPNKLFVSLATIPKLKKLNLSHNKLVKIHYDELQVKGMSLNRLQELDLSYNLIED